MSCLAYVIVLGGWFVFVSKLMDFRVLEEWCLLGLWC